MHDGAEDEWRVARGDGEVGLFFFDEIPGGALGERFGGAVAVCGALGGLFFGDGVPVD